MPDVEHPWPKKTAAESKFYNVDFVKLLGESGNLPAAAAIVSAEWAVLAGSVTITAESLIDGRYAQAKFNGGIAGEATRITCRGTDDVGNVVETTWKKEPGVPLEVV